MRVDDILPGRTCWHQIEGIVSAEERALQVALNSGKINVDRVLECYRQYIEFVVEKQPTYKQFVQNIELKMQDLEFLGDSDILLRDGANQGEER